MATRRSVKWENFEFTIAWSDVLTRYYVLRDGKVLGYIKKYTFEDAENYLLDAFNRAFSKKYYGWERIRNDHNFSVALGYLKGYDYYNPRAKYTIMLGAKTATIYYIDEDYDYAAFTVNPFKKVDKINRVFSTMKDKLSFITGMRVYRKYTVYVLASGKTFSISSNNNIIVGSITGNFDVETYGSPENLILHAADLAL